MKINETKRQVIEAVTACQDKKAENINILELEKDSGAFTDYFVVCSGTNPRQIQAIADEVELRLKRGLGLYAAHIEGYSQAEWVLLDYVDFVVHVQSRLKQRSHPPHKTCHLFKLVVLLILVILSEAKDLLFTSPVAAPKVIPEVRSLRPRAQPHFLVPFPPEPPRVRT